MTRSPFTLDGQEIKAGRKGQAQLAIGRLVTGSPISLPVLVLHGRTDGPTVWISAAIHGDEIGGVEIIRRVLAALDPRTISGTIIAVPTVNVHGFLNGDRYLPDRRDLNRSFPGSENGSLAGQIASLFMRQIVARADIGLDLHTGSDHRTNFPQIRADLESSETHALASAFAAPVMLNSQLRDGSLRAAATESGKTMLLFEGGEAWRFDPLAISVGTDGVLRALQHVGLISDAPAAEVPSMESRSSKWVRARRSGLALLEVPLGERVEKGQSMGSIHDTLGKRLSRIVSPASGIVVGAVQQPLVNRGDALVHVAIPYETSPDS